MRDFESRHTHTHTHDLKAPLLFLLLSSSFVVVVVVVVERERPRERDRAFSLVNTRRIFDKCPRTRALKKKRTSSSFVRAMPRLPWNVARMCTHISRLALLERLVSFFWRDARDARDGECFSRAADSFRRSRFHSPIKPRWRVTRISVVSSPIETMEGDSYLGPFLADERRRARLSDSRERKIRIKIRAVGREDVDASLASHFQSLPRSARVSPTPKNQSTRVSLVRARALSLSLDEDEDDRASWLARVFSDDESHTVLRHQRPRRDRTSRSNVTPSSVRIDSSRACFQNSLGRASSLRFGRSTVFRDRA